MNKSLCFGFPSFGMGGMVSNFFRFLFSSSFVLLAWVMLVHNAYAVDKCKGFTSPGNPYVCSGTVDDKFYDAGNCVWWAMYKRPDALTYTNDSAKYWVELAGKGFVVRPDPKVGDIMVIDTNNKFGHVAYVEKVVGGNEVYVSQMDFFGSFKQDDRFRQGCPIYGSDFVTCAQYKIDGDGKIAINGKSTNYKLLGYVGHKLTTFGGVGSLVNPSTNGIGHSRDFAVAHAGSPHTSSVLFQVDASKGKCDFVRFYSLTNYGDSSFSALGGAIISVKDWYRHQPHSYYKSVKRVDDAGKVDGVFISEDTKGSFIADVPVAKYWQTIMLSTTASITAPRMIGAECRTGTPKFEAEKLKVIDDYPYALTLGHFSGYDSFESIWMGNGSLVDAQRNGFGFDRDIVPLTNNGSYSRALFQVNVGTCSTKQFKISVYNNDSGIILTNWANLNVEQWSTPGFEQQHQRESVRQNQGSINLPYTYTFSGWTHGWYIFDLTIPSMMNDQTFAKVECVKG